MTKINTHYQAIVKSRKKIKAFLRKKIYVINSDKHDIRKQFSYLKLEYMTKINTHYQAIVKSRKKIKAFLRKKHLCHQQ